MTTYSKLPKSEKMYLGIDQSLKCTSLCLLKDQSIEVKQVKPLYMGVQRLSDIYNEFCEFLDAHEGQIAGVAIEGYAYSAKGAVFNLGELGGVLRLALYQRGINSIEVPPTFLKKVITGKGNANKNVMLKELFKNYGIDVNDDNDGDAISLSIVAQQYFETELHVVKAYRTDIHKNCNQIIGEHPNPMDYKEYFATDLDITVAEYEKRKRKQKDK